MPCRPLARKTRGLPGLPPSSSDTTTSQSFSPIDDRPWLVVVSEDEGGRPGRPRVFRASGRQGINYRRDVWHHPLMTVGETSDFLVVDRQGEGSNVVEHFFDTPYVIVDPELERP